MSTEDTPLWRKCEIAWASYLTATNHVVTMLADANADGAPLMHFGGNAFRAPDVQSIKGGQTVYWEVKQRHSAAMNLVTGDAEYWVSYDSFSDYFRLAHLSGVPVQIVLHDSEVWRATRKWLQADVATLSKFISATRLNVFFRRKCRTRRRETSITNGCD